MSDTGDHRVVKSTSTGAFITSWGSLGTGNSKFNAPQGIAVDSHGNVYVTDYVNEYVEKFTSTGTFLTKWGSGGSGDGEFTHPNEIAVDSAGNVYVADTGNNRIEKFSSTGVFDGWTGGCTSGANCVGGTSKGFTCTLATCGATVSGAAVGEFSGPFGVAVDSAGYVYVTDTGNDRVETFDSIGVTNFPFGISGAAPGDFSAPTGIAVDSASNVYVVDGGNNRVEKFTSTGGFVMTWGSLGAGNNQFNSPYCAAVDSAGDVYVADYNNNRIELFSDPTNSATIALVVGWNFISLSLVPSNTAISNVLSLVDQGIVIVWSYQGGAWKSATFNPITNTFSGSLTTMQDGFGYWIFVRIPPQLSFNDFNTLYVLGNVAPPGGSAPSAYSLSAGWNMVGFKPLSGAGETVGLYLASIAGKYTAVEIFNSGTQTWSVASGATNLALGEAMWIYMNSPATLIPE